MDKLSASERKEYERHMEALRYQRSVIQTGWIEGRAEGRAEGKTEGRAEGKAEGLVEGKIEVARSLKEMGLSLEQISKATGLSKDDIEKL